MEVDHEIKLKHLYLHKTDNHTTTHGCDKKGGGGWGDSSDLQGYFDAVHGFCNILKTSKPNPLEVFLVGS